MSTPLRGTHLVSASVLLAFALLSFFPAFSFSYFFNDDYVLAEAIDAKCDHREFVYWGWNRHLGRPLGNYLQCLGLAPISDREHFWVGRLFQVLYIYAFGVLFYAFLVLNKVRESSAVLLAAACISLPGFWYLSALLAGINNVLAYNFAALSAIALHLALTQEHWRKWLQRTAFFASFSFAAMAAFSYQAGLMVVLSFFALPLLLNLGQSANRQRRMVFAALGLTGVIATSYLAWYIGSGNYGHMAGDPYWGAPADFTDRLAWFFDTALPAAASLQFVHAPKVLVIALCVVVLLLLTVASAHSVMSSGLDKRDKIIAGSVAIFALVGIPLASLSPVLVSQSELRYRTLVPLSIIVLIFVYLVVARFAKGLIDRLNRLSPLAVFGLIAPLAMLSAFRITTMNVFQHAQELAYMRHTLELAVKDQPCTEHAHYILPIRGGRDSREWFVPANKRLPTDEFYYVASVYGTEEYPMPSVWNAVYDLQGLASPAKVTASRPGEAFEKTECTVVFDMAAFTTTLLW